MNFYASLYNLEVLDVEVNFSDADAGHINYNLVAHDSLFNLACGCELSIYRKHVDQVIVFDKWQPQAFRSARMERSSSAIRIVDGFIIGSP